MTCRLLILPVLLAFLFLQTGCRSVENVRATSDEGSSGGHVVKMDEVEALGYASIEDVLISRVPGVRRAPDGRGVIIRGPRSIQGSNEPLYVVDGVPSSGSPVMSLSDVEEVEVLKDAAALARFGSRGQHGAILIRTKTAYD